MNKIKILHTADLHIGSPLCTLGQLANIRQAELLDTFGKITLLAKSENVDVMIISGDLFDCPNPSLASINYVQRKLSEIPQIKVFLALGNHDAGLKIQFSENVHVFSSTIEKAEFDSFDVYGVSFESEYCKTSIIEGFCVDNPSKINIIVAHGDLVGKGQTSMYNPVTVDTIAQTGADYVALGHVHQFSGIKTANNTHYAYCGIPEARGFDELGAKGVIIGDVYKNHAELKYVILCKREYIEIDVDVSQCFDYDEICNKILGYAISENNLYKINLIGEKEGNIFLDTLFICDRIKDNCFYVKVNDFTRPKINVEELSKEHSLKGLFVKKMLEQGCSEYSLKCGLSALAGEKVLFE